MSDAPRVVSIRGITKKDVALIVTFLTVFGSVLRYGEKRLDAVEAEAKQFTSIAVGSSTEALRVEREQRHEDIRMINGKLDTIIRMNIQMRDSE